LVENSQGRVRADVVHQRLVAMGFAGIDHTTRRAVAEVKGVEGRAPAPLLAVSEPGMWLQFDWGEGPWAGAPYAIVLRVVVVIERVGLLH
jgi:hypothetical protein